MERQCMVLTEREERDWSLNHLAETAMRFILILVVKCRKQLWIAIIANSRIKEGLDKAFRRLRSRLRTQV